MGSRSIRRGEVRSGPLFCAVVIVVAALAASCGDSTVDETRATPVREPNVPTTTAPRTTSSPTSTAATVVTEPVSDQAAPRLLRFDASGLYLVDEDGEHVLSSDAVGAASSDGMGGAVFTLDEESRVAGLRWWKAGAEELETLPFEWGWTAVLDDRPMLVTSAGDCPVADVGISMQVVDLQTADARSIGCFGGEDGGTTLVSGGGGLLVGVTWIAAGTTSSDRVLAFYDTTGAAIDQDYNPVAESCEPCELDARLSPDGHLLAYLLRPDAKWSKDLDERQRLDGMSWAQWWDSSREIEAKVTVLDLHTGATRFEMAVPAGERLVDFDGRFLVLQSSTIGGDDERELEPTFSSRAVDTAGRLAELAFMGSVRLATYSCCDPPIDDLFSPYLRVWSPLDGAVVNERAIRFEGIADPAADLVAAGRYPVEIEPHGAWSIVLVLEPGGNVATFTATDAAGNETVQRVVVTYEVGGLLRNGGIGPVDFGTPAEETMETLVRLFGPPTRLVESGEHECSAFEQRLDHATWDELGLQVVFTDWEGPLHLASWHVIGPGIATATGIGWGSTVDQVRSAYPDAEFGVNEWAPEFLADGMRGGLDWPDFVADLQVALRERGAQVDVTGEWDAPTTEALLQFIEDQSLHGSHTVLGVLELPPSEVRVSWMVAGQESSCA